jgi:hypothetical protein
MDLAPLALSPGDAIGTGTGSAGAASGAAVRFTAAGYRDISVGTHGFVARVAGTSGPTSNVFRSTMSSEYLPRQYVTPFPYTLVLAGVLPPPGVAPSPAAVPFVLIQDDPFAPPTDPAGGLTARVRVINAAPYADPTGAGAGGQITFVLSSAVSYGGIASYRSGSVYVNPVAGTYTLTMTVSDGTITTPIYSAPVTLAQGEVRTFIVQSTSAGVASMANTRVLDVLDNQW